MTFSKESTQSMEKITPPNSALKNYLDYYLQLNSPGYAVLVTGPWGVGKTHQIKQLIPEDKHYFVSLYGIDSVKGIHDAVLSTVIPVPNVKNAADEVGDVAKSAGGLAAFLGLASSALNSVLNKCLTTEKTIIFDDLERSSLWKNQQNELLGAINHYVEHLGFRVIVICHEDVISDQWKSMKEKTFGQTIKVEPQTEDAFIAFVDHIQDQNSKDFLYKNKALIDTTWRQSKLSSLRVLRYVINDIARLRSILRDQYLVNQDAINEILMLFCVLDMEVRYGNLNRKHLKNRLGLYLSRYTNKDPNSLDSKLSKITSKYAIDLASSILSDELLEAMLIDGVYDSDMLSAWLDQTHYFIQTTNKPWRIVMNFDEVDDKTLDSGIQQMQEQFDNRTVTDIHEFLHISALRLMMVEHKVIAHSYEDEVSLCKAYIDDLRSMEKLPSRNLHHLSEKDFDTRDSYGHGYWLSKNTSDYFEQICEFLHQSQIKALEDRYPKFAKEILHQLEDNQELIRTTLSSNDPNQIAFSSIPVLKTIPAEDFLNAWLSGPRAGWRHTSKAIDNRYGYGRLERELMTERDWLLELEKAMDQKIQSLSGLDAYRIERLKPSIFIKLHQEEDYSDDDE